MNSRPACIKTWQCRRKNTFIPGFKWRREISFQDPWSSRRQPQPKEIDLGTGCAVWGSPASRTDYPRCKHSFFPTWRNSFKLIHGLVYIQLHYSIHVHFLGISKKAFHPVKTQVHPKYLLNVEKVMVLIQTEPISLRGFYTTITEI